MLRRIKRITKRAVSVLKKHMESGGFKTAGVEIGFGGGDGDLPPIEIEMPGNRKLVLNGIIHSLWISGLYIAANFLVQRKAFSTFIGMCRARERS